MFWFVDLKNAPCKLLPLGWSNEHFSKLLLSNLFGDPNNGRIIARRNNRVGCGGRMSK